MTDREDYEDDWPLSFRLAAGLIIAAISILALSVAEAVFRPFFVAVFLAFALRPLTSFLIKRAGSTWLGYSLAVALVALFCTVGGWVVTRDLASYESNRSEYLSSFDRLLEDAQPLISRIEGILDDGIESEDSPDASADEKVDRSSIATARDEAAQDIVEDKAALGNLHPFFRSKLSSSLVSIAGAGTAVFLALASEFLVILVFMAFLMVELDNLPRRIRSIYGQDRSRNILRVLDEIDRSIQRYIGLKVVVSLITALASAVVMRLFGVHYVTTFAILVFLLNFIPYLGSLIATLAPALVFLLQSHSSPWETLGLVAVLTGVQQVIGNVVEPKIQGSGLGVNPVAILLALAFWGWLWGITGMILAVPIAVSVKLVLQQFESTRRIASLLGESDSGPSEPNTPSSALPGELRG